MITRTWTYGTTRRGTVMPTPRALRGKDVFIQLVRDDQGEGHALTRGAGDPTAKPGDTGTLTFTKGGPTGGYWKFTKTSPNSSGASVEIYRATSSPNNGINNTNQIDDTQPGKQRR